MINTSSSKNTYDNDQQVLSIVSTILEKRHVPLTVFQISRILQQYDFNVDLEDKWCSGSQTRKLQSIMNAYSNCSNQNQNETNHLFVLLPDGTYTLPHIHHMRYVANIFLKANYFTSTLL
jgi:hypothetical protein